MTQKRAKENENPEPQTGRGHKLSWGTKNSRIARTRHTATTGTLRERTLRRGPAGGRRRGGRCRHQSPAWCTRHQGTLSAPVWAPATERADGPRCRQGCGGTGTLTDRGGGLRRGALSAEATYKPTARAGHPTPGRRPQSGAGRTQTCARTCRQLQCQPRTRRPPHTLLGGRVARADPRQRRAEL